MIEGRTLGDIVEEHIAAGTVELPVFDRTAARMQQMIQQGEFDPQAVERLVASDPVLSGSLLRHANSSFFGGIEKVTTVRDSIVRLGVKQVAELVILAKQREQYRLRHAVLNEIASELWRHAVACGIGSQWLARKLSLGRAIEEAFLAGLLHDIGKLLLLRVLDDLIAEKSFVFEPTPELIEQLLQHLHCAQGFRLMEAWNLPESYARIAKCHHDEEYDEHDVLLSLVRLVDTACNCLGIGVRGKLDIKLAACTEALRLRASEVLLAELEVRLEDAIGLSD